MKKIIINKIFSAVFLLAPNVQAQDNDVNIAYQPETIWSRLTPSLASLKDQAADLKASLYEHQWLKPLGEFTKPVAEATFGAASLGASYLFEDEGYQDMLATVGVGYLGLAIGDFSTLAARWFSRNLALYTKLSGKRRRILLRNNPEALDEIITTSTERGNNLADITLRQLNNVVNLSIKVYALPILWGFYQRIGEGSTDQEIKMGGLIILTATGALYNLHEMIYTYKTGRTRNDIPVFHFIDGACEIAVAQYYHSSCINRGVEIFPGLILPIQRQITQGEWFLYRTLQMHGDAKAITSLLIQMPLNLIHFFLDKWQRYSFIEALSPTEAITTSVKENRQLKFKRKHYNTTGKQSPSPDASLDTREWIPSPQVSSLSEESENAYEISSTEIRRKQKTRGVARPPLQPIVSAALIDSLAEETTARENPEREMALQQIQELRTNHTVKKRVIDAYIKQAIKFLNNHKKPDFVKATLEAQGHGKQAIILYFEDNSRFRILFEAPHSQAAAAATEYKGYRKDRVLDALQVAYLHGWSEDNIRQFLSENNIRGFYNLPSMFIHVLWARNE